MNGKNILNRLQSKMKILILEDNNDKYEEILIFLESLKLDVCHELSVDFGSFVAKINRHKYDLIIVDLLLPLYHDSTETNNISDKIIENIRDINCENYGTPAIAITGFDTLAEENFCNLNKYDIAVITYKKGSNEWKDSLIRKVHSCLPDMTFEFIIVCALEKEADSYTEAGYEVGDIFSLNGIACRTINIGTNKGLIITPTRMGLVNSAVVCARAIDLFKPKLICMSGICAGIDGKANIYDVIIPDVCHQHDSGKWTSSGFVPELYSVQIDHAAKLKINEIIKKPDFINSLQNEVVLKGNEFPKDAVELNFNVIMAPASSGSSVVADHNMLEEIKAQHRKCTAFEMESFALYEAARQSLHKPIYFSAKSVVDNGDNHKGDDFHRVACLVSAKTVYELIKRGITRL